MASPSFINVVVVLSSVSTLLLSKLFKCPTVERMIECLLTRGVSIVPKSNHEVVLIRIREWNH